eukprot:3269637-Rhodomonas_salina.2
MGATLPAIAAGRRDARPHAHDSVRCQAQRCVCCTASARAVGLQVTWRGACVAACDVPSTIRKSGQSAESQDRFAWSSVQSVHVRVFDSSGCCARARAAPRNPMRPARALKWRAVLLCAC